MVFLRILGSLRKFGQGARGSFGAFLNPESLERVVEEILRVAKSDGPEGVVLLAVYIEAMCIGLVHNSIDYAWQKTDCETTTYSNRN